MTNQDALLKAALLCGMYGGQAVHRSQIFFAIHSDLGSKVKTNDLQRALETAVDNHGLFANAGTRGSGNYVLTTAGANRALRQWGRVVPQYLPATGGGCVFEMESPPIQGLPVRLRNVAGTFEVFRGQRRVKGTDVCRWLEELLGVPFPTEGESAPRLLYDFGVGAGWRLRWLGEVAPEEVPGVSGTEEDIGVLVVAAEQQMRLATARVGQAEFRESLLEAYQRRCAVTRCSVVEVLEAAHIVPYLSERSNVLRNGLLLRTDIHTLFDRGLLSVIPETMTIRVDIQLRGSEYQSLQGTGLTLPATPQECPTRQLFELRERVMQRLSKM